MLKSNVSLFQFSADYVKDHLISALEQKIQKLKVLTSARNKFDKVRRYERARSKVKWKEPVIQQNKY